MVLALVRMGGFALLRRVLFTLSRCRPLRGLGAGRCRRALGRCGTLRRRLTLRRCFALRHG